MTEKLYYVHNKCKHDIGVTKASGMHITIKAGSFQLLSEADILIIEGSCGEKKFFASRMLVIVDPDTKKEIGLEMLGVWVDPDEPKHLSDDEITAMLKKPVKQVETWLENMNDPAELHAVYLVAKKMDLPKSKLTILSDKMPQKDWLDT